MREPSFWYKDPGWQSFCLRPLGWVFGWLTARRVQRPPSYSAKVPVICVGNINVGGTGKTPTVIALVERLTGVGYRPHIVSRGYGGNLSGPIQVMPLHTAEEAGDEPLLLSAFAPVWVSKDRAKGVQAAETAGANVIILDDGFQNPTVSKDIKVVVVDGRRAFGNERVLPAGPLRETISSGLARADIVLTVGPQNISLPVEIPQISGVLKPLATGMRWQGLRVLAFAGIADPSKFFRTLRELDAEIIKSEPLEDHQPLTDALMKRLEIESKTLVAQLVTTEKDAVRLPASFRSKVLTLPVRLDIAEWGPLDELLESAGLRVRDQEL